MSRVQLETRRHSRAAAMWALAGGAALVASAALHMAGPSRVSARLSAAAAHAIAFGMVGDLWLAALLRYLSSQPSRASVAPRLLGVIFVLWNAAVAATAAMLLVRDPLGGRGLLPIPLIGSAAALALAVLVVPVAFRRVAGIPPVAYHHLGAVAAVAVGLIGADLAAFADNRRAQAAVEILIAGGWLPLAAVSLFFAAFDYESYEDRRWPLVSVIAIGIAALFRVSYFYDVLNANGLRLLTGLCGFGVLIALATVLRIRWHGGLSYWFERIAFAGVIVLGIAAFLGLDAPWGSPHGPLVGGDFLAWPSFYGCIVAWAAGFAVMLDQRDLNPQLARLVMWPLSVGALLFPLVAQLSDSVVTSATASKMFLGLGGAGVGVALVVLGAHLLRRPRLRAVR